MAADGSSAITAAWRCTAFATVRERELQFADLQPALERGEALEATLRLREELAEQRRALLQMQEMAARYGCDISHPARTAREAVQWLYFAYGGGEVAERRRHVAGAHGHLPRHLYRTRSARRFIE